LVEFESGAEGSVYDYIRFKEYVAGLFEGPVDVIDRAALKPHLREPSARDAVYAF
jgi:predicted nucleotidyltransferase